MQSSEASGAYDVDRETHRIELRAEALGAQIETVSAGAATLHTTVESATRHIDIPCVRETASVERRSVKHGAAETIGEDRRIVIRLSQERPVVTKQTIVTEDVVLARRQIATMQHITESVRHEELRVAYDDAADGAQ
ncbi:MAG: hypothetical protein NVSMB64_11450 [Candidatus Velthaea sp.]